MKPIITTDESIVIPFEAAIALFQAGCIDPALLGYCLPVAIVERECPQVLLDMYEIMQIANILGEDRHLGSAIAVSKGIAIAV